MRQWLTFPHNMNFSDRGNFIVTASDPAGPWSSPYWLPEVQGLDASLFFDNDGKAYIVGLCQVVQRADGSMDSGIWLREFDLGRMAPVGETSVIWDSALRVGRFPEAPHIYKVNGWYHLVIAEGGTEYYHSVVTARSRDLRGWYEGNPANPVISHRQLGRRYPLHNIGHADLVQTRSGKWYAVMLGSRPVGGMHYNLGRETYLCPVVWEEDWPVFSPGTGKMEWEYDADPDLEPVTGKGFGAAGTVLDDFDGESPAMDWNFWGTPSTDFWRMKDGSLELQCLPRGLSEPVSGMMDVDTAWQRAHNVSLLCRLQHMNFSAACRMRFAPAEGETAGMTVLQAMNHQFRLQKTRRDGLDLLELVQVTTEANTLPHLPGFKAHTEEKTLAAVPWPEDVVILRIEGRGTDFDFLYGGSGEKLSVLYAGADSRILNPASAGTFTGMVLGLFASANGRESSNKAAFDWFEYTGR